MEQIIWTVFKIIKDGTTLRVNTVVLYVSWKLIWVFENAIRIVRVITKQVESFKYPYNICMSERKAKLNVWYLFRYWMRFLKTVQMSRPRLFAGHNKFVWNIQRLVFNYIWFISPFTSYANVQLETPKNIEYTGHWDGIIGSTYI